MSVRSILRLGLGGLLIGSLAACGGSSSNSPTPTPTSTPTTASIESKISPAFAAIFDASNTTDPIDPNSQSVPPLAPASDPVDN